MQTSQVTVDLTSVHLPKIETKYSCGYILFFLYLLQIAIGVLGNALLFYIYTFHLITSHKKRLIDLTVINLALTNTLVIFIRGVPRAIQLLQFKIFLDDIGCKGIIYLQRVSQNISLYSTSLLSIFQAITISCNNARWKELKMRALKYTIPFCILLWTPILLLSMTLFFHVTGSWNRTDNKQSTNEGLCSLKEYTMTFSKLTIFTLSYQGGFVIAMLITSGYMIFILCRHYQQIQHTLGTKLTPRASPEIRATKIILLLVSMFLYFYSVDLLFIIYMDKFQGTKQWVVNVSFLLTLCYPSFIPYFLISTDSQISNSCYVFQEMKNSCLYPPTSQTKHRRALKF